MNVNTVALTGNLTKAPELRKLNDTSVATLRLAVNERVKRNGEWEDRANFFDVTVWGRTAEACEQYLDKGSKVAIQGRLRWEEWEKDGQRRQAVKVVADNVEFMSKGAQGKDIDPAYEQARADDDIPF